MVEKKIKVICCGNTLASDDGVGPEIARKLSSLNLPENVEVIDAGTSGFAIVDMMPGARKVILVDAAATGASPGTVHRFTVDQLDAIKRQRGISLHDFSLAEGLRIAREVFSDRMPVEVVVIGIEAESTQKPRIGLTASVKRAVPQAMEMILCEINKNLSNHPRGSKSCAE